MSVGDRVILGALRLEAVVTALHDGTAELDVRGKRMRASTRDLRVIASAGATAAAPARVSVHVELQPRGAMALDLNVIGCTVDEAIARAERFLDESLLTDQRVIRLIHGYGTGQLKRALAGFSAAASARRALRDGAARTGRRRRDGRGAQGVKAHNAGMQEL